MDLTPAAEEFGSLLAVPIGAPRPDAVDDAEKFFVGGTFPQRLPQVAGALSSTQAALQVWVPGAQPSTSQAESRQIGVPPAAGQVVPQVPQ